jgi:ATP-binding cassette, subfamily A (ABC1), member 3
MAQAVYPAFFSLYVSRERKSGVQAMQLSNGLSNPAGMWLGHFMFDSIFSVLAATVITIVFAAVMNTQFHGLGLFVSKSIFIQRKMLIGVQWLVMVLYGMAATLFAYCVSLVVSSPLAAFAATAGVQIVLFIVNPSPSPRLNSG